MTMEEAFVAYLLGSSGLTTIVSNRIDWAIRPQAEETPSILLHTISTTPSYSDDGDDGLTSSRVQVDCWANTYAIAKQAAREVTSRITGNGAKFSQGGIEFQVAFKEDEQDGFERGAAAEDLFRVRLDFILMYK